MGDAREFRRTVDWRNRKGRRTSFMSLVISPERSNLELSDEEFRRLGEIWAAATNGKRHAVAGYVHRDSGHPHMHLFVPRDLYAKKELLRNHEATRAMIREIERGRDQDREIDFIYEREAARAEEHFRDSARQLDHEPEREEEPIMQERQREEEAREAEEVRRAEEEAQRDEEAQRGDEDRDEEERQVEERRRERLEREAREREEDEHDREM